METAKFKKDGGVITAKLKTGLQPGSYTYLLWNDNSDIPVETKTGDPINPDIHSLPLPNEQNDKRMVEFVTTLIITPPIKDYNVELEIYQDGVLIGKDKANGIAEYGPITIDNVVLLQQIN